MKTTLAFGFLFFLFTGIGWGQAVDTAAVRREVDSLIEMCNIRTEESNLEDALNVIEIAADKAKTVLGSKSRAFASCLFYKARVLYYAGRFPEAEPLILEAKETLEKTSSKSDPDYNTCFALAGYLYRDMGQYEKSEQIFHEYKNLQENTLGKEQKYYALCIMGMTELYILSSQFEKAETYALESVDVAKKLYGDEHPTYISSLRSLGGVYWQKGEYSKAEPLLLQVKSIYHKILGTDNVEYAISLQTLAGLYNTMGLFDKGEPLLLEAAKIKEKILGREHPEFANIAASLGTFYWQKGDLVKSESFYVEATKLLERVYGNNHLFYSFYSMALGVVYNNLGRFTESERLLVESCLIQKNLLGEEHPDYARCLANMGDLYGHTNQYKKAIDTYLSAISIYARTLGTDNFEYARMLDHLALVYQKNGEILNSGSRFIEASQIKRKYLYKSCGYLTENELLNYIKLLFENIDNFYSFSHRNPLKNPQLISNLYDDALFQKGFLLSTVNTVRYLAKKSTNNSLLFQSLNVCRRQIANQYALRVVERDSFLLANLENKADSIDQVITRSVAGFAEAFRQISWTEPQYHLKRSETAIEFTHYQYHDSHGRPTDSTLYAALLLLPTDPTPHYLPLFEEKQLQALLDKTGDNAQVSTNLYAARSGELLDAAPAYGAELYNLIWRSIDSLLRARKIKTVYFSPSGLLHRVAFAALPVNGKKVLSDQYTLRQLGSTRSLVVKTPEPVAQNYTAAVFGGVQYERNTTLPDDSTFAEITDNRLWNLIDRPRNGVEDGFEYLPGTRQEARRLEQLLAQNRVRAQTHTGAQATEEALKALGRDTFKSPDIMHIATHGFFFPDPEKRREQRFGDENVFKWNENPLFRSGLALAGANAAWTGQPTPGNIEDGIVTAYEISHLNLSNTKLAVLSACQTGLGDIKGSEGVYGLQRAFKMAGVDYLLVSLWQVPDKETAEFMDVFYSSWLGGKTIHEAFTRAQKKMRKKYRDPYKWAAWVLVE